MYHVLLFAKYLHVCLCVGVCLSAPRLPVTSDVMWHDIDHIRLVKQALQLYIAVVVGMVSGHGLSIDVHNRKQPNNS